MITRTITDAEFSFKKRINANNSVTWPDSYNSVNHIIKYIKTHIKRHLVSMFINDVNQILKNEDNVINIDIFFQIIVSANKYTSIKVYDISEREEFKDNELENKYLYKPYRNRTSNLRRNPAIYIYRTRCIVNINARVWLAGYGFGSTLEACMLLGQQYCSEYNIQKATSKQLSLKKFKEFKRIYRPNISKPCSKTFVSMDIETVKNSNNDMLVTQINKFNQKIYEARDVIGDSDFYGALTIKNKDIEHIYKIGFFIALDCELQLMKEYNISYEEVVKYKNTMVNQMITNYSGSLMRKLIIRRIIRRIFIVDFNNNYYCKENVSNTLNCLEKIALELIKMGKNKVIIYSHNGSKFDHIIFHSYLCSIYNKQKSKKISFCNHLFFFKDNSIYRFGIKVKCNISQRKHKSIVFEFRDFAKLCPMKLIDVCKSLDIGEKYYKDENYNIEEFREKFNNKSLLDVDIQKLERYLINDVICLSISVNYFLKMLDKININNIQCSTIGMVSMRYMYKYIIKYNILVNTNIFYNLFVRQSYYGGRTYCLKPSFNINKIQSSYKEGNMYAYDVNSLYPYCMMVNKYPVGKSIFIKEMSISKFKSLINNHLAIAHVKLIRNKEIEFSVIPTFDSADLISKFRKIILTNSPFFRAATSYCPRNVREGNLTSIDIIEALKHGYKISKVKNIFYWEKSDFIFKDFVADIYDKRLNYKLLNNSLQSIYKLIMNSSYGKFAQKTINFSLKILEQFSNIRNAKKISNKANKCSVYMKYFNTKFCIDYKNASPSYPIEIASFITAYTRQYMNKIFSILKVFDKGGNKHLYYSDTDSFFVDEIGKELLKKNNMLDNYEIGKLKLENIIKKALFISPKMYYTESIHNKSQFKAKGIKNTSTLTKEDLLDLLIENKEINIKEKQFNKNMFSIVIKSVIKKINSTGNTNTTLDINNNKWIYQDNTI